MEEVLVERVSSALSMHLNRNATFLCERLCAASPTESNQHLLATCYIRLGRLPQAYHALKDSKSAACQYLLAVTCLEMRMYSEAEAALRRLVPPLVSPAHAPDRPLLPEGSPYLAPSYHLLGLICKHTDRRQAAINYFNAALKADAFLWSSFEELCTLGAEKEASEAFSDKVGQRIQQEFNLKVQSAATSAVPGEPVDHQTENVPGIARDGRPLRLSSRSADASTPAQALDMSASSPRTPAGPAAASIAHRRKFVDEGKLRKVSGRLFAEPPAAPPRRSTRIAEVSGSESRGPAHATAGTGGGGAEDASLPSAGRSSAAQRGIGAPSGPAGTGAVRRGGDAGATSSGRRVPPHGTTVISGSSSRDADNEATPASWAGRGVADAAEAGPTKPATTMETATEAGEGRGGWRGAAAGALAAAGAGEDSQALVESAGSETKTALAPTAEADEREEGGGHAGQDTSEVQSPPPSAQKPAAGARLKEAEPAIAPGVGAWGRSPEGAVEVIALLQMLASGLIHVSFLRGKEGIEALRRLPQRQYDTAWVLCQVGKAHADRVEFLEADSAFRSARKVAPYSLDHLDRYSTVLYQLKEDTQLSFLAQEALAIDRLAPQPWCILGNLMSLHKEHDSALRFFRRALQADPTFEYAYTLCGHEHMVLEEFEDAAVCFRAALKLDSRHFTAWYGLGMVYMKQEKFEMAEHHLRRALALNPFNSVLHCYLGTALHALKRNEEAHAALAEAIRHGPFNPLPRFQRAHVLLAEERLDEALETAKALLNIAPQEPSIYFLLGKVYKRLDEQEKAILHLSMALDLKPPAQEVNLIKAFIEKLNVPDSLGNGDDDDE